MDVLVVIYYYASWGSVLEFEYVKDIYLSCRLRCRLGKYAVATSKAKGTMYLVP